MLLELSMLCRLELISNIHSQRDLIINEVCDEQADEVADTANLRYLYFFNRINPFYLGRN